MKKCMLKKSKVWSILSQKKSVKIVKIGTIVTKTPSNLFFSHDFQIHFIFIQSWRGMINGQSLLNKSSQEPSVQSQRNISFQRLSSWKVDLHLQPPFKSSPFLTLTTQQHHDFQVRFSFTDFVTSNLLQWEKEKMHHIPTSLDVFPNEDLFICILRLLLHYEL